MAPPAPQKSMQQAPLRLRLPQRPFKLSDETHFCGRSAQRVSVRGRSATSCCTPCTKVKPASIRTRSIPGSELIWLGLLLPI